MMKKTFLLLFIVCFTGNSRVIAQETDTSHTQTVTVEKFDPSRDPVKDVAAAIKDAQRTRRRILLDVGGEWCKWCHYLDRFFGENKDVADFMHEKFVVVKINFSKENENQEFLSQYPKVKGYPHLFVLERDGTLLHSQDTGELEKGQGHDREKVLEFLKKWAQ